MKTSYKVKKSKNYPGFFFITHEDWMWDNTYLHKNGNIHTYYGKGKLPEDMTGLWDNEEDAKFFLKEFNNKNQSPIELMVEELNTD